MCVCPNCGYCPYCGRSNPVYLAPSIPWTPTIPTYPWQPINPPYPSWTISNTAGGNHTNWM